MEKLHNDLITSCDPVQYMINYFRQAIEGSFLQSLVDGGRKVIYIGILSEYDPCTVNVTGWIGTVDTGDMVCVFLIRQSN